MACSKGSEDFDGEYRMKNILVLGGSGFVGRSLVNSLNLDVDTKVFYSTRIKEDSNENFKFDLEQLDELEKIIEEKKITILINCIAMSNVDDCEKNSQRAQFVNVEFVKFLVYLTNRMKIKLIHFSTNAVYSGDEPLYKETSKHNPKNQYGKLKSLADQIILENCENYCIARIMTVYGKALKGVRTNPSEFIIERLKKAMPLNLVTDIYNNMLYIDDLVKVVKYIIINDLNGSYNISGDQVLSRYEFGCIIAKVMNMDSNIITPCSSELFGELTKRAPDTSFDNSKVKEDTGIVFTKVEDAIRECYL